jgi:hypothetical protein
MKLGSVVENLREYKVRDLNLSRRTLTMLQRQHIDNCATLTRQNEKQLRRIPGIGPKAVKEIRASLHEIGTDIAGAPIILSPDDFTDTALVMVGELITDLTAVLEKHAHRLLSLKLKQ